MANKDDTALVALAQTGDKEAFGTLVDRYQPMALRIAGRLIANRDVARELAQEALLHAYLSLDRLREAERFESWLYGIVLNVCRSHLRSQHEDYASLEALTGGLLLEAIPLGLGSFEPDPQEVVEARDLHRTVLQAVGSLSPKARAATLLFYYDQLTVREIAVTLDISVAAVKGRLHKARNQLRELLIEFQPSFEPIGTNNQEERPMIDVEVIDVLDTRAIQDGAEDTENESPRPMHIVVLYDSVGRRILPLWIGPSEAESIAIGLGDVEPPRPLTYTFITRILDSVGAQFEEGRVEQLKGDAFIGVAKVRSGDQVREIDARPSDAIAMAVYTGKPVRVAEEIMDRAGIELSGPPVRGKGLEPILERFRESPAVAHSTEHTEKAQSDWEDGKKRIADFVTE